MTLQGLGILVLFIALLALAFLVLFNNRRAAVNRRFALSALAIAGWIVSIYLSLSSQDPTVTIWLGRLGFAFASCIPFRFCHSFARSPMISAREALWHSYLEYSAPSLCARR